MEIPSSITQNPQEKKGIIKRLTFLEIGITEILFVGIVLVIFFGVMNFFNILSISDVFPKQLGWLPRQVSTNKIIPKSNSIKPTPSVTSFNYDANKAKQTLAKYVESYINSSVLLVSPTIKQGQSIDGTNSNLPNEFGWYFTDAKNVIFSANLHYANNTNAINDQEIFIQLTNDILPDKIANADLTNNLTTKYLSGTTRTILSSDCSSTTSSSYCQVFNVDSDGKRGYGLLISQTQPNSIFKALFSCFVPKESPDYEKTKSCISPQ